MPVDRPASAALHQAFGWNSTLRLELREGTLHVESHEGRNQYRWKMPAEVAEVKTRVLGDERGRIGFGS